jgi:hypothetical protein
MDFSVLDNNKIINLNINDNNFLEQDLSCFEKFVNLQELLIGNSSEKKINRGVYNRFTGSLNPLHGMIKLQLLYISGTNIDKGLEHLPKSLKKLFCRPIRESTGVRKIYDEVQKYEKEKGFSYDKNRESKKYFIDIQRVISSSDPSSFVEQEQEDNKGDMLDREWLKCGKNGVGYLSEVMARLDKKEME